jgi:hypothetical protein
MSKLMLDENEVQNAARELLVKLRSDIAAEEMKFVELKRHLESMGLDQDELEDRLRDAWGRFYVSVEPIRKHIDALVRNMTFTEAMKPVTIRIPDTGTTASL